MKKLILLLCVLFAPVMLRAQTTLSISTHWSDGAKCTCTVLILQNNSDGSITEVFHGVTDSTGHLSGSVVLAPTGVYSFVVNSNSYNIAVLGLQLMTGFVTPLPLKSATLTLVFTRPLVNGVPVPCTSSSCPVPAGYTPPALATGTSVSFGV